MTTDKAVPNWRSPGSQRFFLVMAGLLLGIAVAGFAGTFFLPIARGAFSAPPVVFIHGGPAFAWVLLFLAQPALIAVRRFDVHVRMGWLGLLLAVALVLTAPFVGDYQVRRELALGLGATAISGFLGVLTSMAVFLGLVLTAIAFRRRGDVHKRVMLLATIIVCWPALFRFRHFLPFIPDPHIWLGVVAPGGLMLIAGLRDRLVHGRVHPVWLWLAPAIFAEQLIEAMLFDTPGWRTTSDALYRLFF